jgi:hypothetical protein
VFCVFYSARLKRSSFNREEVTWAPLMIFLVVESCSNYVGRIAIFQCSHSSGVNIFQDFLNQGFAVAAIPRLPDFLFGKFADPSQNNERRLRMPEAFPARHFN